MDNNTYSELVEYITNKTIPERFVINVGMYNDQKKETEVWTQ